MSSPTYTPRVRTMEDLQALQSRLATLDEFKRGLAFRPRPTDVIITPFSKCGTTWLQQIVHTLRTRGDTDYEDISAVVPWIEMAAALGQDLDAEQKAEPRAFKSHLLWDAVPKGARYIVAIRDPKDALSSWFRFIDGWYIEPGTIPIEEFARSAFLYKKAGATYWQHLASWWQARRDPAVLMLSYEGMLRDPETAIRAIAAHVGIALDDELMDITLRQSSREFMLVHKDKFDDRMIRSLSERRCGLAPGSESSKVRNAEDSGRFTLPPELLAEMDALWATHIAEPFGFRDYAAIEAAVDRGE